MKALLSRLETDGILAVLFVATAIAAFVRTYTFPETAATWPRWVIGSFGLLSLVLVVVKLTFGRKKQP